MKWYYRPIFEIDRFACMFSFGLKFVKYGIIKMLMKTNFQSSARFSRPEDFNEKDG